MGAAWPSCGHVIQRAWAVVVRRRISPIPIFDDNATTPIQSGQAPFFPHTLRRCRLRSFAAWMPRGHGRWSSETLFPASPGVGTFNGWSLSFQKPLPTTGLGEAGQRQLQRQFQDFHVRSDRCICRVSNGLPSGQRRSTVGFGRIGGLAMDPSDPSGNTVYVGGASGGIWKTTNFFTTSPNGPTYIPLTDFGPSSGINISSIADLSAEQRSQPVDHHRGQATGEGDTGTPGVGFLISTERRNDLEPYDSTNNFDSKWQPIADQFSASRDRKFVGTDIKQGRG